MSDRPRNHPSERGAGRVPGSTYRIQFNHAFTFRDAAEVVPYLAELGVSDLYASPYLQARPGSMHGYDITDHNALNPEIGSEEEHARLAALLREHGMGHLLDIVPNHMGIAAGANQWWMNVLENGPSSPFARYFDVHWNPLQAGAAGQGPPPGAGRPVRLRAGARGAEADVRGRALPGGVLRPLVPGGAGGVGGGAARGAGAAGDAGGRPGPDGAGEHRHGAGAPPPAQEHGQGQHRGARPGADRVAAPAGGAHAGLGGGGAGAGGGGRDVQRGAGGAALVRPAGRAPGRPGVPAGVLAGGGGGDQLPALLRRERPGGGAGGGAGGVP